MAIEIKTIYNVPKSGSESEKDLAYVAPIFIDRVIGIVFSLKTRTAQAAANKILTDLENSINKELAGWQDRNSGGSEILGNTLDYIVGMLAKQSISLEGMVAAFYDATAQKLFFSGIGSAYVFAYTEDKLYPLYTNDIGLSTSTTSQASSYEIKSVNPSHGTTVFGCCPACWEKLSHQNGDNSKLEDILSNNSLEAIINSFNSAVTDHSSCAYFIFKENDVEATPAFYSTETTVANLDDVSKQIDILQDSLNKVLDQAGLVLKQNSLSITVDNKFNEIKTPVKDISKDLKDLFTKVNNNSPNNFITALKKDDFLNNKFKDIIDKMPDINSFNDSNNNLLKNISNNIELKLESLNKIFNGTTKTVITDNINTINNGINNITFAINNLKSNKADNTIELLITKHIKPIIDGIANINSDIKKLNNNKVDDTIEQLITKHIDPINNAINKIDLNISELNINKLNYSETNETDDNTKKYKVIIDNIKLSIDNISNEILNHANNKFGKIIDLNTKSQNDIIYLADISRNYNYDEDGLQILADESTLQTIKIDINSSPDTQSIESMDTNGYAVDVVHYICPTSDISTCLPTQKSERETEKPLQEDGNVSDVHIKRPNMRHRKIALIVLCVLFLIFWKWPPSLISNKLPLLNESDEAKYAEARETAKQKRDSESATLNITATPTLPSSPDNVSDLSPDVKELLKVLGVKPDRYRNDLELMASGIKKARQQKPGVKQTVVIQLGSQWPYKKPDGKTEIIVTWRPWMDQEPLSYARLSILWVQFAMPTYGIDGIAGETTDADFKKMYPDNAKALQKLVEEGGAWFVPPNRPSDVPQPGGI